MSWTINSFQTSVFTSPGQECLKKVVVDAEARPFISMPVDAMGGHEKLIFEVHALYFGKHPSLHAHVHVVLQPGACGRGSRLHATRPCQPGPNDGPLYLQSCPGG